MYSLVYVERGFLREPFVTDVALEWALARVRPHVNLEVRLAGERGRTLHALVRPPLHWIPSRHHVRHALMIITPEDWPSFSF